MTRLVHRSALVLAGLTFCLAAALHASAEAVAFDFKDPKGVNGILFILDSELEPIVGMVGGVGGTINYDPADPKSLQGEITVDLAELSLVNAKMTDVLRGWLNISDRFVTRFDFHGSEVVGNEDGVAQVEVHGTMTFGEKALQKTVLIELTHLPEQAKERGGAEAGDLLVLRSIFKVSRYELGIKEDMSAEKVGEEIVVTVPIVGYSK